MASAFPSLAAYGGSKCLINKTTAQTSTEKTLADLNLGTARMVDTFIYQYSDLVRDELPFAKVASAGKDIRVAIIGSGFAGATAAHELKRAFGEYFSSRTITIFEAKTSSDNKEAVIGGRAHSQFFQDREGRSYTNEMGPMRVPENSKLFWHYLLKIINDPNAPQAIFPNPGVVPTQLVYRGVRYTWNGGLGNGNYPAPEDPNDPNVVDWSALVEGVFGESGFIASLEHNGQTPSTIGQLLTQETLDEDDAAVIRDYWHHFLLKYDDVSFVAALSEFFDGSSANRPLWGGQEFNMFSTLGFGTGGFGPLFPVCFLEIFRLLLWQYDQEYSPSLPMSEIVENLIRLNEGDSDQQVTVYPFTVNYIGLSKEDNRPIVSYIDVNNPHGENQEVFDYVIVSAPLRSMQIRMNLDASVPPIHYAESQNAVFGSSSNTMIRESMRIPHIMNSSKLFGFLPEKPWLRSKDWPQVGSEPVKCVLTDTLARQMYFLDPYPESNTAGCNTLISYNWGDDAVQIMGVKNYEAGQYVDPNANPDYVLKTAYQNGVGSSIAGSPVADTLNQITVAQQDEYLQSVIWQEEPMIFGGFKIDYPQQYYYTMQMVYQYQQVNQLNDVRVFLAGNNVSFQGGWIEGAMQSAVNATCAVLKAMDDKGLLESGSYRMASLFEANPFSPCGDILAKKYQIVDK